ncbi:MAG: PAS domain S-box protein [Chloroflexota bacterium]
MTASSAGVLGDPQRLRALYETGLLTSRREVRFDRLARLAARLVGAPMVVIGLVDVDREWVIGATGLPDFATPRCTGPFSSSFARCLVERGEPLAMDDLVIAGLEIQLDPGSGPRIRSAAGAPLVDHAGEIIGALYVLDVAPRAWSNDDLESLKDLAGSVMSEIRLTQTVARQVDVQPDDELLVRITQASSDAIVASAPDGTILSWNAGAEAMFGYSAAEAIGRNVSMLISPIPVSAEQRIREARERGESLQDIGSRRLRKDGSRVSVSVSLVPVRGGNGHIVACAEVLRDITERQRSSQRRDLWAAVIQLISESVDLQAQNALALLEAFCTRLEWQGGALLRFEGTTEEALAMHWFPMEPQADDSSLALSVSALGRQVRASLSPVWLADQVNTPAIARLEGTRDLEPLALLGLPILVHGDVRAVAVLFSTEPRPVEHQSLRMVGDLGQVIGQAIERDEAESALRASELRSRMALVAGQAGAWEWDLETDAVVWSDELYAIYGLVPDPALLTADDFFRTVHPDDRDQVIAGALSVRHGESVVDVPFRIVHSDGSVRWVVARGAVVASRNDQAIKMMGIIADVTERVVIETALQTSEAEFRSIFESAVAGMCQLDASTGHFIRANRAFCQFTGRSEAELRTLTPVDIAPPEDRDAVQARLLRFLGGEVDRYDTEKRYQRPDGSIVWGYVSAARIGDDDRRIASVTVDITERKAAEAALRESEKRFRVMADSAPVLIWVNGMNGCEFVNRAYLDFLGVGDVDVRGYDWSRFIHPDDREAYLIGYLGAERARKEFEAQCRILRFDGTYRWMQTSGVPRLSPNGELLGYVGSTTDISDIKQLEADQAFMLEVADALNRGAGAEAALLVVERHFSVSRCALFEVDVESGTGVTIADSVSVPSVGSTWRLSDFLSTAFVAAAVVGEPLVVADIRLDPRHSPKELGRLLEVHTVAYAHTPVTRDGRWVGGIAVTHHEPRVWTDHEVALLRTTSERIWFARERSVIQQSERDARAAAETALKAQDDFLSMAAHELRTPVTGLVGTAQMLARSRSRGHLTDERLGRALEHMQQAGARLTALTNQLLDVARLRAGRLELEPRLIDLAVVVHEVAVRQAENLNTQHRLVVDVPNTPCTLIADPDRLDQVVVNLISNAVKYSPEGGTVILTVRPDVSGWLLKVTDQGIGLATDATEMIFEPFGRAPNALAQQLPGIGLGLHLCRDIVERHGGRIWAESPGDGQGTTLSVWLPAAPAGVHTGADGE